MLQENPAPVNPAHPYWKQNLISLWVVQVVSQMSYSLALPFLAFFVREMGVNDGNEVKFWVGLLSMAPGLTMAIFAPIWGRISDKYGRKLMVLRSQYASAVLLTLMGLAPTPFWLLIARITQGMVTGTVIASSTFVAANTPEDKMGRALGFLSSANFIGVSLGPAVGGFLAASLGYRQTFWISGGLTLLTALACTVLLKEPGFSRAERRHSISAVGSGDVRHLPFTFKDALLVAGYILALLFLYCFSGTIFGPFLALHLEKIYGTQGILFVTGLVNMLFSVASALAGMTLPRYAERIGKARFSTWMLTGAVAVLILIILIPGFWPFAILYVLYGFMVGAIEPTMTAILAERVDSNHRGALFGYNALVYNLGWFIAPLAGSFVSIRWQIPTIFWVMLAAQITSLFLARRIAKVYVKPIAGKSQL